MKKRINFVLRIFIFLVIFLVPKNAFAFNASLTCSSSSSVTLGNTISVTIRGSASESAYWQGGISYDSSKLQLISGNVSTFTDNATANPSFTYKFKAIGLGSAYVKMSGMNVSDQAGNNEVTISSSNCNINVVNPAPVTPKSSDNNLKTLSIDGVILSPDFNKDTLEYSVTLTSDTTKIKVNAEKNDSKASISGTGEIEVKEGENKIEVVVTAENGSTKTYIINATVEEKEPIIVKVNDEEYTVIRKKDVIEVPEDYTETTVTINGEEIPAYTNEVTGYILVGLKNSDNKSAWYIYDQNKLTYTKYVELKSDMIRIIILKPKKGDVPYKYYESTFEFNGTTIDGYTFDENSDFRLVYGLNVSTGEKSFYAYDIKENTIQRFYNDQVLIYIELVKKCKLLLLICALSLFVLFLSVILTLSKNIKFKKQYLQNIEVDGNKKKDINEVEYKDIEATKIMEPVEEKLSKKELKKQKKEEKKNKKREKTFLDE